MASTRAAQFADAIALGHATEWARTLSNLFARVALFYVDGTAAQLIAAFGMRPTHAHATLSLVTQSPLRWTLEAAAPVVGAGRAPGGSAVAHHLGVPAPRGYAVFPFMVEGQLLALAYVDQGSEPLPIRELSNLLRDTGQYPPTPPLTPALQRRRRPRLPRRPGMRASRRVTTERAPEDLQAPSVPPHPGALEADRTRPSLTLAPDPDAPSPETPQPQTPQNNTWSPVLAPDLKTPEAGLQPASEPEDRQSCSRALADTNRAPVEFAAPAVAMPSTVRLPSRHESLLAPEFTYHQETVPVILSEPAYPRPWQVSLAVGSLALLLAAGALIWCIRPPRPMQPSAQVQVEVPPAARVSTMARLLNEEKLIRQERVFIALARLMRVDRHLRAGIYQIPTGLWPWQILSILHHGQVQIVRVTIPEGLTLQETAKLLARQGLVKADAFIQAAHDPALLKRYRIDGRSAEGFLFPETYRVVRGVSAQDMVAAMIRQFFRRVAQMPNIDGLSPESLYDKVILASLVEREARDRDELPRIAGVFANRLASDMRLESCASVQYVLGHPKEHLQLEDVRTPSPYNTYLHPGLPPGPIANPGAAALRAALQPETHNYLFFFALGDGSHRHHFSRTFGEHQKARVSTLHASR